MNQFISQAHQDSFAFQIAGKNGTYIEIGSHKPVTNSNTYNLEVIHQWRGVGIELDPKYQKGWRKCLERKNRVYWESALEFDYVAALQENNLPMHINYLSCDIEPPFNTFTALRRVIEQGITFDCITFEHDLYNYSQEDYNKIATAYLLDKGYKIAVTNVYWNKPENQFETWFVREGINFTPSTFDEWLITLKKT
jgi:hypothetical protein